MPPKGRYPPQDEEDHYSDDEEQPEDGDDDAIDLDDPENRVIDDDDGAAPSDDDEDGAIAAGGQQDGDDKGGDGDEDESAAPPKEPKVPQFHDALSIGDHKKPLHALDTATINGVTYVAAGGEDDSVTVYAIDVALVAAPEATASDTTPSDSTTTSYTLRSVAVLQGHTDTVTQIAFSPNGEFLATGAMDCHVMLWRTDSWQRAHDLTDLSGEIECLLWHKSGLVLVAGAADAQLVMWNARKGEVVQYLIGHADGVSTAVWSLPDQKKILSGSSGGAFIVFNPKTGQPEVSIMKDLNERNTLISAILPLTEDIAVVGCEDGTMHLISLASGRVVKHLPELHDQCVENIIAHPTRPQFFATCSCDCKIIVWSSSSFEPRATFVCHEGVTRIAWHGDIIVATGTEGDITLWEGLASSTDRPLGRPLQGHTETITAVSLVSLSAGGATDKRPLIVTTSDDGTVRVFPLAVMTA